MLKMEQNEKDLIEKLNLQTENNTVTKNIFDTLAMELCQEENKGE